MPYMNCPRCGLSVALEIGQAPWELCPRCWGQAEVAVPIYLSNQALAQTDPSPDDGAGTVREGGAGGHRLLSTRTRVEDGWIVTLEGELDVATFADLDELMTELEQDDPARLVLDLRALSFLDSTGLATITAADLRAQHSGRRLELMCGDGQARRLLGLTGLDRTLTLL